MKKYLVKEVMTPVVTLIVLIAYVLEATKKSAPMIDGVPQESFFPLIIFAVGVAAVLMLLFTEVKKVKSSRGQETAGEKPEMNLKPFCIVAAAFIFVCLFDTLGFMVMAPLFVFVMQMIYDDKPQQIPRKIIFTILITAAIYILYTYVFDINFPEIWR